MPIVTEGKEKDSGCSAAGAPRQGAVEKAVKRVCTSVFLYMQLPPTTSPVLGASSIIMLFIPVKFCSPRI